MSLATAVVPEQPIAAEPNYDEEAVGRYDLPPVLAGPDGRLATDAETWSRISRPHQFELLERHVYGRRLPAVPVEVIDVERGEATLEDSTRARRIQARLRLGGGAGANVVDVLVYLPIATRPVPVWLGLNFRGNHAETADPAVRLSTAWIPADKDGGVEDHRATERARGSQARRFPAATLVERGYGMATAYCGDIFPDRPDGRADSVLESLGRPTAGTLPPDETGAIGAWAWGLSRILDWLVTLPDVDGSKVIVVGHSRLGKTALWAGACDERFAMVVSNDSGCGGAALERRNYGETVAAITRRFPHWFAPAFAGFADREREMPCDQHTLLAMTAPRPLYVASAVEDRWADPRGEFLAAVAADPVWALFGLTGLGTAEFPPIDTPIGRRVGYHVRSGGHDMLAYDWLRFADCADRELLGKRRNEAADFHPFQAPLPVPAPPGAIMVVPPDPTATAAPPPALVAMSGGTIDWTSANGALIVATTPGHANHVHSVAEFRDADIHAEFMTDPAARGNSGLYIHGHYEMQIYDSYGVEPPTDQDEGSLYRFARPLVNAARPTGTWQVYDVRYVAPRRDAAGTVIRAGTITAWLNGQKVQDGVEFTEPRSPYIPYKHGVTDHLRAVEKRLKATGMGPLFLQDHGSPTRYRNVWIVPLDRPTDDR
ncbi:MAG: family 16 glycoside hydrolase [Planctomycetaceae bacterium]